MRFIKVGRLLVPTVFRPIIPGGKEGKEGKGGKEGEEGKGGKGGKEGGREGGGHITRDVTCAGFPHGRRGTHTHQLCRSARVNVTFRRAATTTNTHSLTHSITYSYGRHTVGTHSSTSSAIVRLRAQVVKGETLSFRQIRLASPLPKKFPPKIGGVTEKHGIKRCRCTALAGSRYVYIHFSSCRESIQYCTANSNGISTANSPSPTPSCNRREKHPPFKPHCCTKADDAPKLRSSP